MTFARKLTLKMLLLLAALALVGGASVWGLVGLRAHFDAAEDQYEQLRAIYEIGHEVATARMLIQQFPDRSGPEGNPGVVQALNRALQFAETYRDVEGMPNTPADPSAGPKLGAQEADLIALLRQTRDQAMVGEQSNQLASVNAVLGKIANQATKAKTRIIANRAAASDRLRTTIVAMIGLSAVALLAGIVIGVSQYRAMVLPLKQLEQGARNVAAADFTDRLPTSGDREFAQVAVQFNSMAEQLEAIYRDLEQQVRTKSQQLVRSERLASVGYLAAGVAHEINNPLGIIRFYADAAQHRLDEQKHDQSPGDSTGGSDRQGGEIKEVVKDDTKDDAMLLPDQRAQLEKSLAVIADEALRCKQITDRLLSLSRPSGERSAVDVDRVATHVESLVQGMPQFSDRRLVLAPSAGQGAESPVQSAIAWGSESELTQVLLNLACNALEAVEPDTGEVTLAVEGGNDWVTVTVADNGRGMTEDVLNRVFEPFFTDKPARGIEAGRGGTGLGLPITHAIVEQHGGEIRALSEGLGKGSTFVVRIPRATEPAE